MPLQPPDLYVNGVKADPARVVMPITVSHGRSSPDSQPDAPTLSVVWLSLDGAPVLGDELRLDAYPPGADSPPTYDDPRVTYDDPLVSYGGQWLTTVPVARFRGLVTDVEVAEYAGLPGTVRISAIGVQADLGRNRVLLARPAESDVARVAAIAQAADVIVEIHGSPGPTLAPDTIDTDALSALHQVCQSSGGLVWSQGDGTLVYGTGDHRQAGVPTSAIAAHAIISGLEWQSTVTDLINRITVTWGPEAGQTQHTLTDDLSITEYGVHAVKATTMLDQQADADQTANLILARRAWPFSRITDVMLDSGYIADMAAIRAALSLDVSDAVLLPIPPDPGPCGLLAEWVVEGWQEEWPQHDRVTLQLAVTDRARFAQTVLRLWADALPNSWQAELDRGSWLDALVKTPQEATA